MISHSRVTMEFNSSREMAKKKKPKYDPAVKFIGLTGEFVFVADNVKGVKPKAEKK